MFAAGKLVKWRKRHFALHFKKFSQVNPANT
jgi:hypothetical protein